MPSEDLHKPLESINRSIAKLRENVVTLTGEVKKIPEAIREAAKTIRDAIQENIQAQAELKLMDHVMEVKSVKPQIRAERDQIETEREELDERLESIGQRYQDRHGELDETAAERIRNLGSHIFEIEEDEFQDGIEDPFTNQVTTTWQTLQAHNADVGEERIDAVHETAGDVVQTIHEYVDRQDQLVEDIRNHRLDDEELSLSTDEAEPLQVPYYVIEYEVDGVAQRDVVVPSRLSSEGSAWCSVSLDPISGAEDLLGNVGGVSESGVTERLGTDDLRRSLSPYGESTPLGLSYTDAVASTLPSDGHVPVAVEGGEE